MKRFISTMVIFALLIILVACDKSEQVSKTNNSKIERKSTFIMIKFEVNPTFYLFFDGNEKMVSFEPLNDDAKTLSFNEIIGLSITETAEKVLTQLLEKGFLKSGKIKITVLTDIVKNTAYETLVKDYIKQFVKENGLDIAVTVSPATDDERAVFNQKKDASSAYVEKSQADESSTILSQDFSSITSSQFQKKQQKMATKEDFYGELGDIVSWANDKEGKLVGTYPVSGIRWIIPNYNKFNMMIFADIRGKNDRRNAVSFGAFKKSNNMFSCYSRTDDIYIFGKNDPSSLAILTYHYLKEGIPNEVTIPETVEIWEVKFFENNGELKIIVENVYNFDVNHRTMIYFRDFVSVMYPESTLNYSYDEEFHGDFGYAIESRIEIINEGIDITTEVTRAYEEMWGLPSFSTNNPLSVIAVSDWVKMNEQKNINDKFSDARKVIVDKITSNLTYDSLGFKAATAPIIFEQYID